MTGTWPPPAQPNDPWHHELPQDATSYVPPPPPPLPQTGLAKGDPRRVQGYNLNHLPHRIRQQLEDEFDNKGGTYSSVFAARMAWLTVAVPMSEPMHDARISELVSPVPQSSQSSGLLRRCFTSAVLVDSVNHKNRLVPCAMLTYGGEGRRIGHSGSVGPGSLTPAGPIGDDRSLSFMINEQVASGLLYVEDGSYLTGRQNTSVTVTYDPNWVPPNPPVLPGIPGNPFEPCFFDADFLLNGKITS